jgi:hypothetical protein
MRRKAISSQAIERATHDSVAFRFIAGNEHPNHDTIAAFRKRFLPQIEALFVKVLKLARTMKVAGGSFEQCYNAQAVVATGSMLIVATEVTQAANDKEQLMPMIEKIQALPKKLGRAKRILADSGYFSQANVESCAAAKIEPLIAIGRSRHHVSWKQRFAAAPPSPLNSATPLQKMTYRLKTPRGRELYALRKQTPEPVFGINKSVMGYRQCLLRGLENVKDEWNLVTMSWNIKRMFAMQTR